MKPPKSSVYVPASQRVEDVEACRALLEDVGAALWITGGDGVPSATLLPTLWVGDRLITHASAHNEQFMLDGPVPCRVVVQGPHTYVTPRWYPSVQPPALGGAARGRAEGRAVGTWDYEQVQVAGILRTHRDPERLLAEAVAQAEHFDRARVAEGGSAADAGRPAWTPAEAPADFMDALVRGIVGIELEITEVVGRSKLSQNRTQLDRDGLAAGLRERGRSRDVQIADAVDRATPLY